MGNFDPTTPLDTDFISLGDDKIREFKVAIQEALRCGTTEGTESVFPGSAPTTAPIFRYRGLSGVTGLRPTAGQYGFFFDETRNALQRDSGSVWVDVGTVIPAGTKMVFYQASAPTGWVAEAVNDKFLRVVTAGGTGGTTGGTVAASTSLSHDHTHTHTTGDCTLTIDQIPSHSHSIPTHISAGGSAQIPLSNCPTSSPTSTGAVGGGQSHNHGATGNNSASSQLGVFAYADIIIATKS